MSKMSSYDALRELENAMNTEGIAQDKIVHAIYDILTKLEFSKIQEISPYLDEINKAINILYDFPSLISYVEDSRASLVFVWEDSE